MTETQQTQRDAWTGEIAYATLPEQGLYDDRPIEEQALDFDCPSCGAAAETVTAPGAPCSVVRVADAYVPCTTRVDLATARLGRKTHEPVLTRKPLPQTHDPRPVGHLFAYDASHQAVVIAPVITGGDPVGIKVASLRQAGWRFTDDAARMLPRFNKPGMPPILSGTREEMMKAVAMSKVNSRIGGGRRK